MVHLVAKDPGASMKYAGSRDTMAAGLEDMLTGQEMCMGRKNTLRRGRSQK